jgi:hypothetical protein
MRPRTGLLAAALGLGMAAGAWAQLVPQEANTARKAAQEAVRKSRVQAGMTNAALPESSASTVPAAASPGAGAATGAASARPVHSVSGRGKRDPFVSIIQASPAAAECSGKNTCLVIDEVVLKGVVKGPEGMLALVESGHHRAFFLRENDPVFNGEVVHIGMSSITFREKVLDKAGRERTREVVRPLAGSKPGT